MKGRAASSTISSAGTFEETTDHLLSGLFVSTAAADQPQSTFFKGTMVLPGRLDRNMRYML